MAEEFSVELKQRQRYWLDHLQAASAQGMKLAEYARVAQVDCDALYRWRGLFKRKGISIDESSEVAPVSFAALRVAPAESCASGAVMVQVGALIQLRRASLPDPRWLAELLRYLQEQR